MKKVISKGYTITVTSWENDGDNYRTKSMTVENKDEAIAIGKMCKSLFKSSSNNNGGIGNLMDDDVDEAEEVILMYVEENPEILLGKKISDEEIVELINNYNYKLMGGSECYYSRVCEKCDITYSENDVYLEEVKF